MGFRNLLLGAALALAAAAVAAQATAPVNEAGYGCSMRAGKAWDAGVSISPPGLWQSHWCLGKDGKHHLRVTAVAAGNAAAMASDYMKVQNADDYNAALDGFMAKYPAAALSINDPSLAPIWKGALPQMLAARPADPAPPVTLPASKAYIVEPNGVAKTRQWYPFAAGVGRTSTAGGGSVTIVGTACKPEVASVTEVGVVYAAFGPTYRADRVTRCVPQ